nr:acyl-CoA reductase [Pantoea sp. 201603H]
MYLIQGTVYSTLSSEQLIALLTADLNDTLSQPLRTEILLSCAEQFVRQLQNATFLPELDVASRIEICQFCQPKALRTKLEHELGDSPFSLRRPDYQMPRFESWRPLGVVVHITPANAELLPFFAVIESLLVGNINWLRLSSSEQGLTLQLLKAFIHCDSSGELVRFIAVVPVATHDLPLLLRYADGVSAWGGDVALDAIRQQLPGGCRWIPWGHKISFAWLMPDAVNASVLEALADEICRFDQMACSSPQIVFVDTEERSTLQDIGSQLAQAMQNRHSQWQPVIPDEKAAADITSMLAFSQLDTIFADAGNDFWVGEGWRIILQLTTAMEPSPLYRTILLRPLPRQKLIPTLRIWRTHLQTCGLAASEPDIVPLSQLLLAAGVSRITGISGMHESYSGEPHDGMYALSQLARRVSVTLNADMLPRQVSLDFNPPPPYCLLFNLLWTTLHFLMVLYSRMPSSSFAAGGAAAYLNSPVLLTVIITFRWRQPPPVYLPQAWTRLKTKC